MKRYASIFGMTILLVIIASAMADAKRYVLKEDEPIVFDSMVEALPQLNRIKPMQNPKMVSSEAILDSIVSDNQNKIVGSVEDVIVNEDGSLSALRISFDRLRLSEPVYLSASMTKIVASSNGYKISLIGANVVSQYPQMLAEIETAAGTGYIPSMRKIVGSSVFDENQQKLGEITDILMNKERTRIDALYLMIDAMRDEAVAVPFAFINFEDSNGVIRARISNDDRDAVLQYLEN